jgi:DnaJ-class molecular chaperone
MEDLFGWWFWWQYKTREEPKKKEPVSLDFEKTYEVPIFDLILGCKIEVKWVYWDVAKLKIPASTKPWAKFRVKGFWKKEPGKEWNLIVKIEAVMPKHISDVDMSMLERIRENIGY